MGEPAGVAPGRCCVVCGSSLVGRRSDALHCSPPCRSTARLLRAILSASPGQPYVSRSQNTFQAVIGVRRRSRGSL